ncbi:hypothetical protein POTOM_017063 [Populus tomentosa]|uniref:Uncharacterized protein n=1 Tax=Populus tomentosa TaxID=118781 RepID=A0A8X8CVE1_POPTO|nr:hypothetical protein POTOM_017063 [Populus tomentosa]
MCWLLQFCDTARWVCCWRRVVAGGRFMDDCSDRCCWRPNEGRGFLAKGGKACPAEGEVETVGLVCEGEAGLVCLGKNGDGKPWGEERLREETLQQKGVLTGYVLWNSGEEDVLAFAIL